MVLVDGREVGWVGELHPEVAERFDWAAGRSRLWSWISPRSSPTRSPASSLSSTSRRERDLAVVVASSVPVGEILAAVESLGSPILAETRVFDVYEGRQVPRATRASWRLHLPGRGDPDRRGRARAPASRPGSRMSSGPGSGPSRDPLVFEYAHQDGVVEGAVALERPAEASSSRTRASRRRRWRLR